MAGRARRGADAARAAAAMSARPRAAPCDDRVAAVDQQLHDGARSPSTRRRSTSGGITMPTRDRRRAHQLARSSSAPAACATIVEHLGRLQVARPARARAACPRLVEHAGRHVAHVEVDRVAEQQHLHHRHADDHAERDAVARQLPQLPCARSRAMRRRIEQHHAARSGGALRAARRGDEHVLEARRATLLDARARRSCREQRARTRAAASAALAVDQHAQPLAELRHAARRRQPARARRARAAKSSASISTTRRVDVAHQLAAARPRDARGRGRGSRARGSARPRPCSASRRGSSCRAATSANRFSQKSRRLCGSTALVGSSSNSSSGSCSVAAASARRWLWPPRERAGALLADARPARTPRARSAMRARRRARSSAVDRGHELEVLAHASGPPTARSAGSCSRAAAQRLGVARHLEAEHAAPCRCVGSSSPHSMRIVVDLPEPFGPRKP